MNPLIISFTKKDVYYSLFKILFLFAICYTFHRYIFQYGHSEFLQRDYRPTPVIWQVGKYIVVGGLVSLIYAISTFETYIKKTLFIGYGLLCLVIIINVTSSVLYQVIKTDEFEYQLFALLLFPLCLLKRDQLMFLGDAIRGPWLNAAQWILLATNAYVIANYFLTGRLPFHAYPGIIVRFGGLWDDPNALAIFSVFLFVYAFWRGQYGLAGLHIVSIVLTFSLTGVILLVVAVAYLSYRRIRLIYIAIAFIAFAAVLFMLVYVFQEQLWAFYEIKRESIELHTSVGIEYKFMPLLQPMIFHETWWVSLLYNYTPFSIPLIGVVIVYTVKAFFFDAESLQRFYIILFVISSLFLPFMYIFPLNFLLLFWGVLYLKGVRF